MSADGFVTAVFRPFPWYNAESVPLLPAKEETRRKQPFYRGLKKYRKP